MELHGKDDEDVRALLAAQTPPPRWVVYRVLVYGPHKFQPIMEIGKPPAHCARCPLPRRAHDVQRDLRVLTLLVNGPMRRLTVFTDREDELPRAARNWLHTLYNLAEAANVRIDSWVAYDGRG